MCGITAYAGREPARDLLLDGLERLEYRGYDSAGLALQRDGGVEALRAVGRLEALRAVADDHAPDATIGLGHTRWATHGRVTEANAHPHADEDQRVFIVLNGIVENYAALRDALAADGVRFSSETDAEVVAHLLARHGGDLAGAAAAMHGVLEGQFAFVAVSASEPGVVVATRRETPLLVGHADHGTFVASALPAFLEHTRSVSWMDDGDVVRVDAGGARLADGRPLRVDQVDADAGVAERGGFETFMRKEIDDQPHALAAMLAGRVSLDGTVALDVGEPRRVVIVGCGTSFHAGLAGRDAIEEWARIPCAVEIASEWRSRTPLIGPGDLVIGVTQSGETADTLAAMRLAREGGARVLAVTNVLGSQATREAHAVLDTRAGIEVGVAATKTFAAQVAALQLVALAMCERPDTAAALRALPAVVRRVIDAHADRAARLAADLADAPHFLFLGRHAGVSVAMEGALKLKEVSYAPADAYPAGEMKHGPIALVDEGTPVIVVGTTSPVLDKLVSNVQEVRARGARVIAVTTEGDGVVAEHADESFEIPRTDPLLQAIPATVPLQLLAHEIARARGHDVDRPRNLAKTVTVE